MERRWAHDPRYSHGYLVPAFALYLLWSRRDSRRAEGYRFCWLGPVLVAAGAASRLIGAVYYVSWLDATSLLVSLAGLVLSLRGWAELRWALPSIAFLIFMVPLPYRAEVSLGYPLQRVATVVSTYVLQVFGLPAFSSGTTIVINDFTIGIVDACNGIGISYMFLACAVAAAFMVPRPLLDRVLLIVSALPIALVVNVMRIVTTGALHELIGRRVSEVVYHDLAGWLMMFVAFLILSVECRLLPHLFVEVADRERTPAHPALANAESHLQTPSRADTPPLIPLLLSLSILLSAAMLQGHWVNRWEVSHELERAVSRLDRVPLAFGDWKGQAQPADSRSTIATELNGILMRRYENRQTGRAIGLLIVCGRPGPASVHTPDICYPGAGFAMVQSRPVRFSGRPVPGGPIAELFLADFQQSEAFPPEHLRIYWSWSATGRWSAPENPRIAFATRPFLYKMYLFYRSAGSDDRFEDESWADFLRQLMPELERALFPKSAALK
jgi:exosortase